MYLLRLAVFLITVIVAGAACADRLILRIPIRDGAPKAKLQDTCAILLPTLPDVNPLNWDAHRCGMELIAIGIREVSSRDRQTSQRFEQSAWRAALRTDVPALSGCGNFVLDELQGEQCDDGNVEDGDGCDELCILE